LAGAAPGEDLRRYPLAELAQHRHDGLGAIFAILKQLANSAIRVSTANAGELD
jgi:hypothetical protein